MRANLLCCSMTILCAISVAPAATTVWYTGTLNSGPCGVIGGGPGTVLELVYSNTASGACSWTITMHADGDDTVGLIAWASDLSSSSSLVSVTGSAIAPGSPFNSLAAGGLGGSGASLLVGSQGQTFGTPVTTAVELITFTLQHTIIPHDTSTKLITERAGNGATGVVWAGGDGDYAVVSFAGGPALPHPELSNGGLVIRITEVPEPATMGLLAFGGLVYLGRNRRNGP